MHLIFEDEYGEELHRQDFVAVPRMDDLIILDGEEFIVKSVIWDMIQLRITVKVTQSTINPVEVDDTSTRLREAKNAILAVNKRVAEQEKKVKSLREQLVSVRTFIRTQGNKK